MSRCALLFLILFPLFTFAQNISRYSFDRVLNVQQYIADPKNIERTFFSDMGAWHGYAMPEREEDYGSFIGPEVMDMDGEWLANTFSKLEMSEGNKVIDLSKSKAEFHYYPGVLKQTYETEGLIIEQRLIFVSNRTAMISTRIKNNSGKNRTLTLSFSGKLLGGGHLIKKEDQLIVHQDKKENHFVVAFSTPVAITIQNSNYSASVGEKTIAPGQSVDLVQTQSYYFNQTESQSDKKWDFESEMKKNENRWNGYLNNYFYKAKTLNESKKRLAVKSMITLITNWRSAAKDILHDGVFPSVNYQGFYAIWSWDSWKQAVGLALFHPALAKENVRSMFDYINDQGMVVDCIYASKEENNWRDTKPPLAAWAVWNIFEQTKDQAFVKEMYPLLAKYHRWWYENRDHNKNGLCEYGSTDGTRIAAAWESGMDNAVRFDSAVMTKNNDNAWSLNQESVDLNAYLYAEKLYFSKLAKVISSIDEKRWTAEAMLLQKTINHQFFDSSKNYYYDRLYAKQGLITIEGTEGWIPMWAGIANTQQAQGILKMMNDETKFNTKVPFPTLAAGHPKFDPLNGYWRGPVWLDQFYFAIDGLIKYGYSDQANAFTEKLFSNGDGLLTDQPICENYHPLTGQGLNAKNFSWSAAHILMLLSPSSIK